MVKAIADAITGQIKQAIDKVRDEDVQAVLEAITSAKRIFIVGSGRSGLAAKSFAHRIVGLGYRVFVVGETITPSAKTYDVIIAVSGSGETTYTLNVVEVGKKIGATIVAITSYPSSPIGRLADVILYVPGRLSASDTDPRDYLTRQITGIHEPLTPKGGVFELATLVLLECIIQKLKNSTT